MKMACPPREANDGSEKEIFGGALLQGVGQVLAEFDAMSTDRLTQAQESAASFGEDSTRVSLLKGMPAFTKPSR
jgi:hypothetical protein